MLQLQFSGYNISLEKLIFPYKHRNLQKMKYLCFHNPISAVLKYRPRHYGCYIRDLYGCDMCSMLKNPVKFSAKIHTLTHTRAHTHTLTQVVGV